MTRSLSAALDVDDVDPRVDAYAAQLAAFRMVARRLEQIARLG